MAFLNARISWALHALLKVRASGLLPSKCAFGALLDRHNSPVVSGGCKSLSLSCIKWTRGFLPSESLSWKIDPKRYGNRRYVVAFV